MTANSLWMHTSMSWFGLVFSNFRTTFTWNVLESLVIEKNSLCCYYLNKNFLVNNRSQVEVSNGYPMKRISILGLDTLDPKWKWLVFMIVLIVSYELTEVAFFFLRNQKWNTSYRLMSRQSEKLQILCGILCSILSQKKTSESESRS